MITSQDVSRNLFPFAQVLVDSLWCKRRQENVKPEGRRENRESPLPRFPRRN